MDIVTRCFTSSGALGRKRSKDRRHTFRQLRRRGELAPPSQLLARFELQDVGPVRQQARYDGQKAVAA